MQRRLTSNERCELGVFVGIAAILCTLLAAAIQLRHVPAMTAVKPASALTPVNAWPAPIAPTPSALDQPTLLFQEPSLSLDQLLPAPALPQALATPAVVKPHAVPAAEIKNFGGKPYRLVKTLRMRVTAYAADPRCTYPFDGKTTASGMPSTTNGGKLVAADTSLISMHSLVSVPGYASSTAVPVLDRGGAIKGYRLDVLLPSYEAAQKWGSRMLDVKVYGPVK